LGNTDNPDFMFRSGLKTGLAQGVTHKSAN